jgi:hypothetical protein
LRVVLSDVTPLAAAFIDNNCANPNNIAHSRDLNPVSVPLRLKPKLEKRMQRRIEGKRSNLY